MLADNWGKGSFSEAVQRTFDGQHPCALCHQIAKGKQSEKKSEFSFQLKKLEFLSATGGFLFSAPASFWLLHIPEEYLRSMSTTPPTPPPRPLLA